jgi:hypothetical protein
MPTKFAVVLLTLLCGCSTTATISRINGTQLHGEIQRGDQDTLVVETNAGNTLRIPKSEISDIDHPGNVVGVIGGIVSAYGLANIAVGWSTCAERGGAYCAGTFAPAALGLPMLIWGIKTWSDSTQAVDSRRPPARVSASSPPPVSPFDVSASTPGGQVRPPRERAGTGGLQHLRWGMSPEQVRRLYADVEASSPDLLSTRRVLAGSPATVHFGFLGGQLTRVQAELVHSQTEGGPTDVFGHFKQLLGQQYGPPLAQSEGSVTWSAGESTIQLLAPGDPGAPVKLVYERGDSARTALDAP